MTWRATVLTLFPDMFPGPIGASLLGKALEKNLWSLDVRDIREHGLGKHRTVDDTPSGGGPGMVMRADVACAALYLASPASRWGTSPASPRFVSCSRPRPPGSRPNGATTPTGRKRRRCSTSSPRRGTASTSGA